MRRIRDGGVREEFLGDAATVGGAVFAEQTRRVLIGLGRVGVIPNREALEVVVEVVVLLYNERYFILKNVEPARMLLLIFSTPFLSILAHARKASAACVRV